jgi:hypothetical protein
MRKLPGGYLGHTICLITPELALGATTPGYHRDYLDPQIRKLPRRDYPLLPYCNNIVYGIRDLLRGEYSSELIYAGRP